MRSQLTVTDYKKVLHFLTLARSYNRNFRHHILNCLADVFGYDHMTFLLSDFTGSMNNPIEYNINREMCRAYENYYHKADIFNHMANQLPTKKVLSIHDLMPSLNYKRTEFYNDFLHRYNFFHELAVPLRIGQKIIGGIGIFRQKGDTDFAERDLQMLSIVADHVAYCLQQILEVMLLKGEQHIMHNNAWPVPAGVIVADQALAPIHLNHTAPDYCREILGDLKQPHPVLHVLADIKARIPPHELATSSNIYIPYGKFTFKIMPTTETNELKAFDSFYLIYILKSADEGITDLARYYNLTAREVELILLVAEGLNNKDIAAKLYISIHTVKAHLEKIYKKMNVGSRTSMLSKIGKITPSSTSPFSNVRGTGLLTTSKRLTDINRGLKP